MRPVATDPGQSAVILEGDYIRILTSDGQRRAFRVVDVNDEAIEGEDVRITYPEIVFIESRQASRRKMATGAAVGAGVATGVVLTRNLAEGTVDLIFDILLLRSKR
ncbi:MAG: hypothetical protein HKN49_10750 [Gammaproteobacteria bacterium]|nr:hypothetical protein [Gammaproteobacteria bacterium]